MNEADRKEMKRKWDNCTADSEMDARTTDQLEELIYRARAALNRRCVNARKALGAVEED